MQILRFSIVLLTAILIAPIPAPAQDETAAMSSFLPVWKLLSNEQKTQFIAGYLKGWQDAAHMTDIAISYVKENPGKAVEGLIKIRSLYDLNGLKPENAVNFIDQFYSKPEHRNAPLSLAVTAARNQ